MAFSNFVDLVKWVGRFLHEGTIGLISETSAPGTPPLNQITVYARKTVGLVQLFYKDSAGVEHDLSLVSTTLQAGQAPIFITDEGDAEISMSMPGPAGQQGLQGLQGVPGIMGEDGELGELGPPGLAGATGATGADGATGATGATGIAGPPGLDADEPEIPLLVPGPKGDTGATGAAGANGADGANGAQGPTGPAAFLVAEEGEEGSLGPPGPAGTSAVNHNILSSTHGDSTAGTVVRGDLIVGNSTPSWIRLAIATVAGMFLRRDSSGDASWTADVAARTDATNNRFRYLNITVKVFHSVNQSIPDSTFTVLAFDSESFDTHALHDPVTNNSRITVPIAGKYLVQGYVEYESNTTGSRWLRFLKNGTGFLTGLFTTIGGGNVTSCFAVTVESLAANDYIEMSTRQDSGGALNATGGSTQNCHFSVAYIGE